MVVNGLEMCKGLITRERSAVDSIEKSIKDFVTVSQDLVKSLKSMMIDDDCKYVLTKLTKTKKGLVKKESDHNTIVTELKIEWKPHVRSQKTELFNLNDRNCQDRFKYETDNIRDLLKFIYKENDLDIATKKVFEKARLFWIRFITKIRITEKVDKELEELYQKRGELRNQTNAKSKKKLEYIEKIMADKYSEEMYYKIKEDLKEIKSEDGG